MHHNHDQPPEAPAQSASKRGDAPPKTKSSRLGAIKTRSPRIPSTSRRHEKLVSQYAHELAIGASRAAKA